MKQKKSLHRLWLHGWVGLALCWGCTTLTWAADPNQAASYALRLPLETAPQAALQRLPLPPQVLTVLQTPDYSDVRIFNAAGQPVPLALMTAVAPSSMEKQWPLEVLPMVDTSDAIADDNVGFSVRVDRQQGRSAVSVVTAPVAQSAQPPSAPAKQSVVGYLLDARAVVGRAVSLALEVDFPPGQPVWVALAKSRDLKTWESLAETVLYRAPDTGTELGSSTLPLDSIDVKGHYLQLSWRTTPEDWAPSDPGLVQVRKARLSTTTQGLAPAPPRAQLGPVPLESPHSLRLDVPFATPIAALDIGLITPNALVPVHVLGRGDPAARTHTQASWTPLAQSVIYQMQSGAQANAAPMSNTRIVLPGGSWRQLWLKADTRTAGFSAAPTVAVEFEPVALAFIASGDGPFTLAAGMSRKAGAVNPFIPLSSLIPGYQSGAEGQLLPARVLPSPNAPAAAEFVTNVALPLTPTADGPSRRTLVLWGVLIVGVLLLAGMTWVLLRQRPPHPPPPAAPPL